MTTGSHCGFYWVQWENKSLSALLLRVPEIVLGHYLVNTSFDSGSLALSDAQGSQGWFSKGTLAFSPIIGDVAAVPHEQFEEWLVFPKPVEVFSWEPVVNFCGLSLTDRSYDWVHAKLWAQLERYQPESFLAHGERLLFITHKRELRDAAISAG